MDELNPRARAFVSAWRGRELPDSAARERVRQALALSLGQAAAPGLLKAAELVRSSTPALNGAAGAAPLVASVSIGKLALLVGVGALCGSALMLPTVTRERAARGVAPVTSTGRAHPPLSAERAPEAAAERPPVPPPSAEHSGVRHAARSGSATTLGDETRLLERARAELNRGSAARCLALLDEYEARFARGVLREEASASRVLALCALGDDARARSALARFREQYPRSPLGPRVERACAGGPR